MEMSNRVKWSSNVFGFLPPEKGFRFGKFGANGVDVFAIVFAGAIEVGDVHFETFAASLSYSNEKPEMRNWRLKQHDQMEVK